MLVNADPILFRAGPLVVRWYGAMMALSMAIGYYYLLREGKMQGISEEILAAFALLVVAAGIVGARMVFVLTNWDYFALRPLEIVKIYQGGLSFHGGVLGGYAAGRWYLARRRVDWMQVADLVVPGLAVGYSLVRIANIFNQEILGRLSLALPFFRHPTQLYGSAIGVILLLIHNRLAYRHPPPGYLFGTFVFYYSLLRGVVEETFRDNPLVLWGYVSHRWGIGLFTLTQVVTPLFLFLGWFLIRRSLQGGRPLPPGQDRPA